MRRDEFEDDDVLITEDEEEDLTDGGSGSEQEGDERSEEEDAPPSPSGSPDDDDDGDDEDDEDEDMPGSSDEDDDDEQPADPRFDLSDDDDSDSESDDPAAAAAAARRRKAAPSTTTTTAVRTSLQKMDTEEQRAMLAGELTPEEALLRVEARELARRARRAQRKRERAASAAVSQLATTLRAAMPADGTLPADARALAGAFMDALIGREAADMVARSATAPPPAGVARLGPAALGAAVPEEPLGAGGRPLSSSSSSSAQRPAVVVVDVALALPAGVLAHKDHVGYRYHARRAVYLAAVAAHLAGGGGGGGGKAKAAKKSKQAAAASSSPFSGWRQQWLAGGAGGGDPTLPRLVLWPPEQQGFVLRLTAVPAAAGAFPPHRLHPDRNNVRWVAKPNAAAGVANPQHQQTQQQDDPSAWLPTPAYNAALLAETHALAHASFLASAFGLPAAGSISSNGNGKSNRPLPSSARSEAMADALALLQLWARRAGVAAAPGVGGGSGAPPPPAAALAAGGYPSPGPARCPDGLTDHFLAMLLAHCCPGAGPEATGGSDDDDDDDNAAAAAAAATPPHPLQAARAALRALADAAAWCAPKGVAMARWGHHDHSHEPDPSKRPPSAKALAKRHEVVFVGPEGWGNLATGVSAGALQQASAAARRALALLERPAAGAASEALAAVFMDAPPTAAAFDYVWRVRLPPLRVCAAAAAAGGGGGGDKASGGGTGTAILGSDAGRAGLLPGAALHAHAAGDACGALAREQERRAEGWARRALGDRAALLRALARPPPALPRSGPCADASRVLGSSEESMFMVLPERADGTAAPVKAAPEKPGRKRKQPAASDDDSDEDDADDASLTTAPPPPVLIACVADPAQAARLVDVGPAADDPKQATRFRALWGARSELRRLADGRICESVSWAADVGADGRHAIPDLAVAHVLRRHLPGGCAVVGCASALDPALRAPENEEEEEEGGGAAAAAAQQPPFEDSDAAAVRAAEAALERLARALRSLPQGAGEAGGAPGLPLRIVAALPASAAAGRRTLPFPPRPHPLATSAAAAASDRPLGDLPSAALGPAAAPLADAALGRGTGGAGGASSSPLLLLPRCLPDPLVVVAQLEGSGRWPDEPRAFSKMKLAMAAQLATALARAHPQSCARAAAVELDVGDPEAQGAAAAQGIVRAASAPSPGQEDGGGAGGGGEGDGGAGGTVELLWEGFAARVVLQTDRDAAAKQRALAAAQAFASAAVAANGAAANGNGNAPPPLLLLRSDLLRLRAPPEAAVAAAHHGLIAAVAAAHPAFAPTCRLAARWVGCHLASGPGGGLRHEAIELLVAAVFGRAVAGAGAGGGAAVAATATATTGTAAATAALCAPPASRAAGFLRFLRLLEQFPWSHRPLVVDPQGELEAEGGSRQQQQQRRRAAEAAFAARREAAAALRESAGGGGSESPSGLCSSAMFIATPRDMEISYWTLDGPSDASLARLRAAAGRCAAALAAMVERGPGIGAGAFGSPSDEAEEALRDARDDDSAWMRALFSPELGFGALLLLRPDALPSAGRALPCARRALARALAAPSARRLPRLDPARDRPERAVLHGFPPPVVRSQPAARLSQELLVGFDPLSTLVSRLSAALGSFASFSVDFRGGTPCVGVRWRCEAFAARPLRAGGALAHCCVPMPPSKVDVGGKKAKKRQRRRGAADEDEEQEQEEGLVVVPDVSQVLHEAQEIGAGIVDRVLLLS